MTIRSLVHKGLRQLYTDAIRKGVPPEAVDSSARCSNFLDAMQDLEELRSLPTWKAYVLTGYRKGTWSLHVTRKYRLTFGVDAASSEILDVDLEDYH